MRTLAVLCLSAMCVRAGDLPIQCETGGGDDSPPAVNPPGKFSKFAVDIPGAEGMNAFWFQPDGIIPGKRYPLLFVLHGNGDGAEGRHRNLSNVSSKEHPVFVVAIQYQKEAKMGSEGWGREVTRKSWDWLLEKSMKELPVDPDQVYLQGFSMGAGFVGSWAYSLWKDSPETLPFRALFFNGGMSSTGRKEVYPPVPYICMVGEKETAVLGSINVVEGVRDFCNELSAFGLQVEYHEIPGMEHSINQRCHKIIRDTILALHGPRDPQLPHETGELAKPIRLLKTGKWTEGLDALKPLEAKETEEKLRKKAADVRKRCETWAAAELKRLEGAIAEALVKRKWFDVEAYARMRAVAAAFPDQAKSYPEKFKNLEKKQADEIKRRVDFLAARAREQEDFAAAKALYQELAKAKDSRTAKAASYRLFWWQEKKK